jgi:hypothetical protein
MRDPGHGLRLAQQARLADLIPRPGAGRLHQLEGQLPIQLRIVRGVDHTHPALAQLL